ncbi:MAG: hypothetical protein ACXWLM_02140 [Myxococcales bacterium]
MRACALALLSLLLLPRPSKACSVCGCDPSGGTLGLDRPSQGDLRLGVENRYLQKESGAVGEGTREGEREDRLDLRLQYAPPVPRLSFQLEVPIYAWKAHYGLDSALDDTTRGLSDIALTARYEVLKLGGLVPRHVLALTATVKAPTGDNSHLAPVDGGMVDEHKQVGTGSWDGIAGAWYTYGDFPTVAYVGVSARANGSNSRGSRYGNALFGTVGVRRTFLESQQLFFALDAQGRNAGKDTMMGGYDPNSGGFVGYLTGTAGYALTHALLLRGTVQVPVVTALNGAQSEHPVAFLALAWDFTL